MKENNNVGAILLRWRKKLTQEEFIKKAKLKHESKYDYSKITYVDNRKHITITCKIHGDFLQKAGNHLNGHGCKLCRIDNS